MPLEAEGEFALVREHLEVALKKARIPAVWGSMPSDGDSYALLAEAAAGLRAADALQHYAALLEEWAGRYDHKLYLGVAHRAWGVAHTLAGEYVAAKERLDRALRLFRGLKTRWQMGRTLYELAELAVAQRDTRVAHRYFSRALAAFEEIRAAPDAARARARLDSLGGPMQA